MDTLFTNIERFKRNENAPLAVRMRPQTLAEYVGQSQAVGPDSWLRRAIEHDALSSVIYMGRLARVKLPLLGLLLTQRMQSLLKCLQSPALSRICAVR